MYILSKYLNETLQEAVDLAEARPTPERPGLAASFL